MSDKFEQHQSGLNSPATNAFAITPDDETDLAEIPRGIYIGTAGDLTVTMLDQADEETMEFVGLNAGSILPVRVKRVWEASTATDLVGLI